MMIFPFRPSTCRHFPRWQLCTKRALPRNDSYYGLTTLTHVSNDGNRANMVDVGSKAPTRREATARCVVHFPTKTLCALGLARDNGAAIIPWQERNIEALSSKKGPILGTAIVAGVMAAKKTSDLLPFCHPLPIDSIHVDLNWCDHNAIEVTCHAAVTHTTGVEMEALTGASAAALCIYDMCKASSHDIRITDLELLAKKGGKQDFER